jgi:hypothetical protein
MRAAHPAPPRSGSAPRRQQQTPPRPPRPHLLQPLHRLRLHPPLRRVRDCVDSAREIACSAATACHCLPLLVPAVLQPPALWQHVAFVFVILTKPYVRLPSCLSCAVAAKPAAAVPSPAPAPGPKPVPTTIPPAKLTSLVGYASSSSSSSDSEGDDD